MAEKGAGRLAWGVPDVRLGSFDPKWEALGRVEDGGSGLSTNHG